MHTRFFKAKSRVSCSLPSARWPATGLYLFCIVILKHPDFTLEVACLIGLVLFSLNTRIDENIFRVSAEH